LTAIALALPSPNHFVKFFALMAKARPLGSAPTLPCNECIGLFSSAYQLDTHRGSRLHRSYITVEIKQEKMALTFVAIYLFIVSAKRKT
jgi:hypothetical protein